MRKRACGADPLVCAGPPGPADVAAARMPGRGAGRRPGGLPHKLLLMLLLSSCGFAAVTGTVINGTTGKPQAGATVGLNRLGQNGIELIDQAKSDAQGNFTINQEIQGPHVLRTVYAGVSYNHMLPPGSPTTGVRVEVYDASKEPGEAKITKHMLMFEPAEGSMTVNETFLLTNSGKTAWNDPDGGTVRFYLPAGGKAQVNATAPGGMPIGAAVLKTGKPGVMGVDFPVKPGDTRMDVSYTVPYKAGEPYAGKIPSTDENTYLIAPSGITMTGDGLNDLGQEPKTQAHIYGISGATYKVTLSGTAAAAPAAAEADQQDSGPQIEQILPRLYSKAPLILGVALGILALGFVLLYRAPAAAPKETNERGRR
jgi:hypothetical protein